MKKNGADDKGNFWKILKPWGSFGALVMVLVWSLYMLHHGSFNFSSDLQKWAHFGDYFTGVAGPLLSFLAMCLVAYSIFKTHETSSEQLTALQVQNRDLATQVGNSSLTTAVDFLNRVVLLTEQRVHLLKTDCKDIKVVGPLKFGGALPHEIIEPLLSSEGYSIKSLYDFGILCTQFLEKTPPAPSGIFEWGLNDNMKKGTHDWLVKELNNLDDNEFDRLIEGLYGVMDAIDCIFNARKLFEKRLKEDYSVIRLFASLPEREIKVARALSLALIAVKDKLNYKNASIRRKILISNLDLNEYRIYYEVS